MRGSKIDTMSVMKKLFYSGLMMLMILISHVPQAHAADEKMSRPATKADLVGVWEMASVQPIHDKNDPVFFPYQRFVFGGNASMKFISSEKPFTKEWLDKFKKQPAEIDFSVNEKGVLTLSWQKIVHAEKALCTYVLKDVPVEVLLKLPAERKKGLPKKGNLTLSFLNKDGRIAYQKVLSKIA